MKNPKKTKVKKKNIILFSIIILVVIVELVNPIKLYNKYVLKNLNYSDKSIEVILKNGLKKEIVELGYNKTLDNVLGSDEFIIDYYDTYKAIDYYDIKEYTNTVNTLITKGYKSEDINYIFKRTDNSSLENFLSKDYIEDISDYLVYDFAYLGNIERYVLYQEKKDIDKEKTVIYVNIGLDKDYYSDVKVNDTFSYDMLINKYHGVSENFVPNNLVSVPDEYGNNEKLNEKALENFINMSTDCKKATGYKLLIRSGYRDYESQQKTYNSYLKTYGKKYTEDYVTHPGSSEHHTGLAIDIKAESSEVFASSRESKWVNENAYKYGYILRYTKEYENITGIKSESWHFRYVGIEIAEYLQNNKMSYEEYYVRFIEKYNNIGG